MYDEGMQGNIRRCRYCILWKRALMTNSICPRSSMSDTGVYGFMSSVPSGSSARSAMCCPTGRPTGWSVCGSANLRLSVLSAQVRTLMACELMSSYPFHVC